MAALLQQARHALSAVERLEADLTVHDSAQLHDSRGRLFGQADFDATIAVHPTSAQELVALTVRTRQYVGGSIVKLAS